MRRMDRPGLGLRSRGFLAYLATQFVSALTDNAYKFLLVAWIAARAAGNLESFGNDSALTGALFAAPFVLFGPWAGVLADRVRKSTLLVLAMATEMAFMLATGPAFATGSLALLWVLIALSSIQSTFFGPAKYGFLPEMVAEHDLSRANGLVNMTTFVAIIVGQVLGGALYDGFHADLTRVSWPLGAIGAAGLLAALAVPRTPAGQPALTFGVALRELRQTTAEVFRHRGLLYTVLGIGHFFMLGAVLQFSLFAYGEHALGLDKTGCAVLVALALVGIALGSLAAAAWSGRHIELGLVPLGALGSSAFLFALAASPVSAVAPDAGLVERLLAGWMACVSVVGLGAAAGLFVVPLNANLQVLSPEGSKGRFLAFGNMVSFVGVFLAAGGWFALSASGLDVRGQSLVIGLFSLLGTLVSLWLLPEACLRLLAWALAHSAYRIRVLHVERLPERGGALLVANHVSWVDWLILSVITRRKIRFLIQRQYFEWPPINWLLRLAGCIPVASGDTPEIVAESLARAGEQLAQGHLVGIFAEGTITRTGHMQTIRRGYQRIVAGRGVPILPVYLDGLWGSVFSHEGGRFLRRLPRRIPFPVTVVVGEPLPGDAQPWHLRAALQRLSAVAFEDRRRTRRPLHLTLLRHASGGAALHQPGRPPLARRALLARALALRDALRAALRDHTRVGVLLPHGQDAAVALLAVHCAGRVPVPLDPGWTASELDQATRRAGVELVLTDPARAARLPAGVRALDVSLAATRRTAAFWRGLLLALLPAGLFERLALHGARGRLDDDAALVFSAGTADRPKLVPLSHQNVLCNVEAVRELLALREDDLLVSLLPTSLALGLVHGLWLPLLSGTPALLLPDPLDGRAVGRAVTARSGTILLATPRLLELYLRDVSPGRFGSLRLVIVFGERLRPALREAFEQRFGLRPIEALSSTECAGLVALGTPDVRSPGHFQRGARPGWVGHPLPGLSLEVVDSADGSLRAADQPGELRVRGPAVVRGYPDDPALQARAFRDGWYVSGDEAVMDEDGFVRVTGRFARASVIDGRRVAHAELEDALADLAGTAAAPLAVLEAPGADGRPRLVVCHVRGALDPARAVAALRAAGLAPPLLPRVEDFVEVEALPLRATGTVDFPALRKAVAGSVR